MRWERYYRPTPTPPTPPPEPPQHIKTKHNNSHFQHIKKKRESRAPASENENGFVITIAKHCATTQNARAQIHWWPQVKMHFFGAKISIVTYDNFSDCETQGLRVYLYIYNIYIYKYKPGYVSWKGLVQTFWFAFDRAFSPLARVTSCCDVVSSTFHGLFHIGGQQSQMVSTPSVHSRHLFGQPSEIKISIAI